MSKIKKVMAREVLDSRGNPTIEVDVICPNSWGRAIVPSGASTGEHEALELRDGKKDRFFGKGVKKAIFNVNTKINRKLRNLDVKEQRLIDQTLIDLDGTPNKRKLGANAVLGVSMAAARAGAMGADKNLYEYLNGFNGNKKVLPIPFANIINGGVHAGNKLVFQEFMIAPVKAKSFFDATRMVSETYHALKSIISKKYGKTAVNVGDEGGFAPPIETAEEALDLIDTAISKAGYNKKVRIAIDAAASEFFRLDKYVIEPGKYVNREELVEIYKDLIRKYKVISIEDPFDQDDFDPWEELTLKSKIQIVGDDLLATNPERIKMAYARTLCNALLLKVNQIGTLTQAMDAARLAKNHKWGVMVSHRSGESEDPFIADLAVALGNGQIKLGAPARGERTSKYNQLIRIEEELGKKAKYAKWE
ncbi:phosphopyruvate hydratase [Candidatus Woesearchaeota archaeon]|nr:phosphopyruvate hydratase [Candidatus Woesearchaeota archaeon]